MNFNRRDFYMRDMNRDRTGDVDRESDAKSRDSPPVRIRVGLSHLL